MKNIAYLLLFCLISCTAQKSSWPTYLHHNDIKWNQWGPQSLAQAQKENRPLLLYFAEWGCVTCLSSSENLFSDSQTVRLIQDRYFPIFVDTQTNPAVHQFLSLYHRSLGRPLELPLVTVLFPDSEHILFSHSNIKARQLKLVLQRIQDDWDTNPKIKKRSRNLLRNLKKQQGKMKEKILYSSQQLSRKTLLKDFKNFRFTQHQSFTPSQLMTALRLHKHKLLKKADLKNLIESLDSLVSNSQYYDLFGGGFYDFPIQDKQTSQVKSLAFNTYMLTIYSLAEKLFPQKKLYSSVIDDTLSFISENLVQDNKFFSRVQEISPANYHRKFRPSQFLEGLSSEDQTLARSWIKLKQNFFLITPPKKEQVEIFFSAKFKSLRRHLLEKRRALLGHHFDTREPVAEILYWGGVLSHLRPALFTPKLKKKRKSSQVAFLATKPTLRDLNLATQGMLFLLKSDPSSETKKNLQKMIAQQEKLFWNTEFELFQAHSVLPTPYLFLEDKSLPNDSVWAASTILQAKGFLQREDPTKKASRMIERYFNHAQSNALPYSSLLASKLSLLF